MGQSGGAAALLGWKHHGRLAAQLAQPANIWKKGSGGLVHLGLGLLGGEGTQGQPALDWGAPPLP